jgi:hypothetical protein
MSSNGGGGSNLLDMGLMIAAGVAAPELAPELLSSEGGFMGLEGTQALTAAGAVTGAGLSGLAAGVTGQDPLRAAAMGGIGGAASGYMQGSALADAAAKANAGIDPNVMNQAATDSLRSAGQLPVGTPMQGGTLGVLTPQQLSENVASGAMTLDQANTYGQGLTNAYNAATVAPAVATPFSATTGQMVAAAAPAALGGLSQKPAGAYTPPNAVYKGGNLQYFKYDPRNYQPDVVVPPNPLYHAQYAEGGIASLNTGGYVGSATQGIAGYARGGKTYDLGDYSDGGRLLKGPGDGMSDDIPAKIGGKQEARLADGEFVVPADVVSHLGNGSTDAGAKHLYKMMDKVRKARTGNTKQGKQIKAEKYLPA